jgi:hypothetical protein
VPAAQAVQVLSCIPRPLEKDPAAQSAQVPAAVAPKAVEYFPAVHESQTLWPVEAA